MGRTSTCREKWWTGVCSRLEKSLLKGADEKAQPRGKFPAPEPSLIMLLLDKYFQWPSLNFTAKLPDSKTKLNQENRSLLNCFFKTYSALLFICCQKGKFPLHFWLPASFFFSVAIFFLSFFKILGSTDSLNLYENLGM